MQETIYSFTDHDHLEIFVYKWLPDHDTPPASVLLILHGMGEHAGRYRHIAKAFTDQGHYVYAMDQRGHGLTANASKSHGYMGLDGFNASILDVHQLMQQILSEFPSVPLFLLGHSMGSFTAMRVMQNYGELLTGVILSGSSGKLGHIVHLGIYLARRIAKRYGENYHSQLLSRMSFGRFNKSFSPSRTDFDWLSRDQATVDQYVEDPLCKSELTAGSFRDFLLSQLDIHIPSNMHHIPKNLPIYILSGDQDPVGKFGKSVLDLVNTLKSYGIQDIEYTLYLGARHEILNETNKEEVILDIITWVSKRMPPS